MTHGGWKTTAVGIDCAASEIGSVAVFWKRVFRAMLVCLSALTASHLCFPSELNAQESDAFDALFEDSKSTAPVKRPEAISARRKRPSPGKVNTAHWDSDVSDKDAEHSGLQSPTREQLEHTTGLAEHGTSVLERETARLQLIEWQYNGHGKEPPPPLPEPHVRPISFDAAEFIREDDSVRAELPQFLFDSFPGPTVPEESGLTTEFDFPPMRSEGRNSWNVDQPSDQPEVLRPPSPRKPSQDEFDPRSPEPRTKTPTYFEPPLGFTGPSSVLPSESQESEHFVPIEDRWRSGFPEWDRYGKGNPRMDDQPYEKGHWWDPYNQNVLKGDFPIIGQHTFFSITATEQMLNEFREVPTGTTPFESTVNPGQNEFFGKPDQYFFQNNLKLQMSLTHGDTAFKPFDWQVRVMPVFNMNYLSVKELGVVNPDVRQGKTRFRTDFALEEWFVEAKLADLSPDYDFMSIRAGSQPFVSDFRGFVFADTNRAVRLFGTRLANRDQFNLVFVDQTEKETNSGLNTFDDRNQTTLIANYFRQDFIFPGYTSQLSFHYNNDGPSTEFDRNNFPVRPDPAGSFQPHRVEAYYMGWAGDGHIGRINVSHAFYHVEGRDSFNPIQGQEAHIRANMAAAELSYDRDWIRFRTSYFWASGDDNPNDCYAEGFDTILDNPNFAGGQFSYWQRQSIRLFGVNLVQRDSLVPDLRSSKTQGQSNFVNPGLHLVNGGMDFELTPKLKAISNVNLLWFDTTESLERFAFQDNIRRRIGTDLSLGLEYRPRLSDNIIVSGGVSSLVPGKGFDDLFGVTDPISTTSTGPGKADTLHALFLDFILTY